MAYAAEWDLDDDVLDREEVEAVVQHVAALGHVSGEVSRSGGGLICTFRFPVSAAAHVVGALDPDGRLLGDEWYRDLDPPDHAGDAYTVRLELIGPVDGGRIDDADLGGDDDDDGDDGDDDDDDGDDGDVVADARTFGMVSAALGQDDDVGGRPFDDEDDEDDDEPTNRTLARLRVDSQDNREAWPVAFALAAAVIDRLGGDLRDDFDEDLFQRQLHLPQVTGPAVVGGRAGEPPAATGPRWATPAVTDPDDADDLLN
ncbi:MAG: hypothetical protein H6709_24315 [Kofleriaceae bacterium]|nr:hypothetical protein [Kofleriaceae bacterium]